MKFFELDVGDPELRAELEASFQRVLSSGQLILGPELDAFEREFAAYCEARHAVGVGNGLDALTLALRAAGIGRGDEVIVPSHTFIATWLAVTEAGARPVPAEPDPGTFTISADGIRAAMTPRTAAVIPVSLYGHPVDMDPILSLAATHGLWVLEDAAQSHGARYRGRRTGSLAHATAFSFYPTKNLGALGDGGAVVTSDPDLAEKLRKLRNYGSARKYEHELPGVNSRLDELQAAFLRAKLPRLDAANAARQACAADYARALTGVDDLILPDAAEWAEHVYHLYVVRCVDRNAVQARLAVANVQTLIHYPLPCHMQPAFAELGLRRGEFPIAERLAGEVLSLPMWPRTPPDAAKRIATALGV